MRPVTRNLVIALLALVVVLLALGALPGFLQSGDPYYVEASVVDGDGANAGAGDVDTGADADVRGDGPAIAADNLSEQRFPYAFGALEAAAAGETPARSKAYYRGPVGFKEAFTHTPFDEFAEFETRNREAVERGGDSPVGDVAVVEYDGQRYRLEIVREST